MSFGRATVSKAGEGRRGAYPIKEDASQEATKESFLSPLGMDGWGEGVTNIVTSELRALSV